MAEESSKAGFKGEPLNEVPMLLLSMKIKMQLNGK